MTPRIWDKQAVKRKQSLISNDTAIKSMIGNDDCGIYGDFA